MEKTPSASETVATHEKAKPLLLEREMDICEKPHPALWFSKKEEQKTFFSLLKSKRRAENFFFIIKVNHICNFDFIAGYELRYIVKVMSY